MEAVVPLSHQKILPPEVRELTYREWEVLLLIACDMDNAEIADQLNLTEKSVQNYRYRIACKLDLQGRHKLAKYARKHAEYLQRYYELLVGKLSSNLSYFSPPPNIGYLVA
ncbi:LuxR C-terminal-related transcriptional regulator [Spirosoma sp. SC4-14]|uniref:response regulator transcription factor n=1 Tax=Spirosoma sp. SC4-14 TaxID=3128900 RepID=UPI0030CDEAD9